MAGYKKLNEEYGVLEVVRVQDIETKDGKKFKAYKTERSNGKLVDLRFTRECRLIPSEPCYIKVKHSAWNLDENRKFPIVWVKAVEEIIPYGDKHNDLEF